MFKIYKITANDTNMVYLGLSKVDLYHRFYTQLNYSKKTGKLKEFFNSKTFSIEQIENNIQNRDEAKLKLEHWKSIYSNNTDIHLITDKCKRMNKVINKRYITCECGSTILSTSVCSHKNNKVHRFYEQNKGLNKFESFCLVF